MQILTTSDDSVGAGSEVAPTTWQQHMKHAIRSVSQLLEHLKLTNEPGFITKAGAKAESSFPLFAPLPYVKRIPPGDANDPLLRQILPLDAEDESPSHYSTDPLAENAATLRPGVLQKYHGRVLVVTTGACAIHCRYCFRRHFPYADTGPLADLREELSETLAADETIEEVILSGGDPLTLVDDALFSLIDVAEQAKNIKRLRIHSRLPIVIPQRVTDSLVERLRSSRLQKVIVIHANHANEIDDPVVKSLQRLSTSGATMLNQSVLLRGVNDSVDALVDLGQKLMDAGVLPYYLHQLDPVIGAAHFEVSVERGRQLIDGVRARSSGYTVPRYVQELAGQPNKTVLA